MQKSMWSRGLAALLSLLVLAGCSRLALQSGQPHNRRDTLPGPGILSGDAGEFIIYQEPRANAHANTEY